MTSWFKRDASKHIDKSTIVGDLVWFWPCFEPEPFQVMVLELPSEKRDVKILAKDQIKYVNISLLWVKKEDAIKGGPVFNIPIVRQVFTNLIANEIVSVQPMTLPSKLTFFMDYSYGTTNNTKTNDELVSGTQTSEKEDSNSNS